MAMLVLQPLLCVLECIFADHVAALHMAAKPDQANIFLCDATNAAHQHHHSFSVTPFWPAVLPLILITRRIYRDSYLLTITSIPNLYSELLIPPVPPPRLSALHVV